MLSSDESFPASSLLSNGPVPVFLCVITAEETVYEWTFDEPTNLTNVVFMVCPGEVDVHGQFQIISFEVTLA